MIQRILFSALILLVFLPGYPRAAEILDLYQVDVELEDKGAEARDAALKEAMGEVLVRVSGRTDVLLHPVIQKALDEPKNYAITYQYLYLQKNGGRERTLVLRVKLSERNINALLRQAKLPVWGKSRPGVLVWLVVDNGKQRYLQGATYHNWVLDELQQQARDRGLPIQLPLLDAEDQSRVKMSDIWGGFTDPVQAASRRYQNEAVLMGRVYYDSERIWHARWTLIFGGQTIQWEVQGRRLASVLEQAMDEVAERIAFEYAHMQSEHTQSVYLRVSNIQSLEDLVRVQTYLQNQVGVTEAQPLEVKQGVVFFRLTLDGRWHTIAQSIGLGNQLVRTQGADSQTPPPGGEADSGKAQEIPEDLIYQYRYLP